ncbi:rhomboid family intramembrane serine protease [Microscilla marina]|uniref:Rhomboid family protein n=1 Tax=Microscilla marina ATCC 23134 TaxID=313606 RepID=A1ZJ06_MICM2|nr:rhomboid family intramembrane serine protease [Microscilla marina]EAY29542.1 rhomboid family protein [Microscilla marina ATCC 23134]
MLNDLKNAFRKPNNALTQIIIINVIGWVAINLIYVISPSFFKTFSKFLFVSGSLTELMFHPWTVLTYAFSHHDLLHIVFNMLTLYWFGMLVSEYLNSKRLISLYVLGALAGAVSYILIYNFFPGAKTGMGGTMLGASGAVFAVVVGAATLMPNYSFHLIFIGPVRIKYIAALLVLLSVFQLRGMNAGGQVAHLGGALMGYLFVVSLNRGTDLGGWIHYIIDGFTGLFRKKSKMKVTYRSKVAANAGTNYANANRNSVNAGNGTPDQAEIDAILDKISESGYESLSKEEKQQLFNASKKEK